MPMPPSDKKAASAARHDYTPRRYIGKQLPNRANFLFNEYVRVFRLSIAVSHVARQHFGCVISKQSCLQCDPTQQLMSSNSPKIRRRSLS
ncbi:hypothetical protein [Rhizobium sp. AB2/73]|uniref:hypothetical protein n=1 Tax=Rhizobium sp. AB2/73 TaxID=2795216 RepID=UPI001C5F981A|nr:hypothetical protein [Rhizobium sp. AB2/73]QYA13616.1 hypothetical protein J5284_05170 [Rhizobium sp. AB2/73]